MNEGPTTKESETMKIALLHDHYDAEHLAEIKIKMESMGAPKIKAVWMECYGHYAALEGAHRVRAAKDLGIVPMIDELEHDDVREVEAANGNLGLDLDNPGMTYGEVCDGSYLETVIDFDEDE